MSSNQLVKSDLQGGLPAVMADLFKGHAESLGDLTHGVVAGFPTISFRGKVWRVRKGGEEVNYTDQNGDAVQSLELVLVKANPRFSKVYYDKTFEEGETGKPSCWSADGEKPDAGVLTPQCKTCAACPMNEWGSTISESGKKGRACKDRRRLAVVSPHELTTKGVDCDKFLLAVPAASLKTLSEYADKVLKPKGIPYFAVVTRIGFDTTQAYPALTFKATRYLTEAEARMVLAVQASDEVHRILQESKEFEGAAVAAADPTAGIEGTMPASLGVAAPAPAATQVAPAAPIPQQQAASPTAAPQTAVQAEVVPAKPKRTRTAKLQEAAPVAAAPPSAPVQTSLPAPEPAGGEFENMLDMILKG